MKQFLIFMMYGICLMALFIPKSSEAHSNFSFSVNLGPPPVYYYPAPPIYVVDEPVIIHPYGRYYSYPIYPAYYDDDCPYGDEGEFVRVAHRHHRHFRGDY